jgi:FtsZ-binding cell division protein ZapB
LSEEVEQLKAENETLSRQCSELETELATVKIERDDYAATVDEFIKDHKRWQERALHRRNVIASLMHWE